MIVNRPLFTGLVAALALVTAAGLAACGSTDQQIELGAVGVEAEVGALALRDIELDNPPPGGYETGSAARLNLAIVNQGREDDYLVDVSGEAFDAVVVDDAEPSTALSITIPAGATVYTGSSGDADLILVGMDESLLVSETVSVTLTFQEAGAVTLDAVVSAPLRLTLDRYLRENRGRGRLMAMRALTVIPGAAGTGPLSEVAEPDEREGSVLVSTIAIGICGTDREILSGAYGQAPPGEECLVLGHESLGRVVEAAGGGDLAPGDLVVGIVRRPDPVPCINCAAGEWDMCRNGRYTEHGIKGLHGFARDRYRAHPDSLVKLDPALGKPGVLLEPTSVVAKAWEHIERIGRRAVWEPRRVLITGAGPVGLLAALLAVQRGLEVHVLDRITEGRKPDLVEALGAQYHSTRRADLSLEMDIVLECTGAATVIAAILDGTGRNGIVCLGGVSSPGRQIAVDIGGLNRELVLDNDVVFGSVNANRRHYEAAAEALAAADASWLARLLTREVPIEAYEQAMQGSDEQDTDSIKTVVTF